MTTQREASRLNWTSNNSSEDINSGSLQRIADACETMAASYDALRGERDRYERWYKEANERVASRDRQIAALRGHITRLKRLTRKGQKI